MAISNTRAKGSYIRGTNGALARVKAFCWGDMSGFESSMFGAHVWFDLERFTDSQLLELYAQGL